MSQSFSARVEQRLAKVSQGASEDLWRYREAASILVFFDYESLQPLGVSEKPSGFHASRNITVPLSSRPYADHVRRLGGTVPILRT